MPQPNQLVPNPVHPDGDIFTTLASCYQIDPVVLRRVFLLLTRNHYAQPSYFGRVPDSYRAFMYSDDSSESSLKIELDYAFDPRATEQPTGIYIGVGDVKTQKQVIDSYAGAPADLSGHQHVDTDTAAVSLTHVSLSPDEALQMGVISKGYFQGMRDLIKGKLGLRGYQVVALTAPRMIEADSKNTGYRVDLVLQLTFSSNWQTQIESHRIKKVSFEVK